MQSILGQDEAIAILTAALTSGRVHHAWVFSGPRGVGKFTTAVEFARLLLDEGASVNLAGQWEADPAGRASRLIDAGSHPDLHVIRKELALFSDNLQLRGRKLANIPIDVLRQYMIGGKTGDDRFHEAPAYRTSMLGRGKVFIIDEAELIDLTGQNSLLKTLEEPPAGTYLFLITARPERLLLTIRSRCQHVRFRRLDAKSMTAWLGKAKLDLTAEECRWIESFSDGSPGVAQLAAEYGFCAWHHALAPMIDELFRGVFPVAMGETMARLVDEFATSWVKKHTNASKDAANKDGASHVLSLLAAEARRRLREACAPGDHADGALGVIDLIHEAEEQLEANVNMKQVLENLAVQGAPRCGTAVGAPAAS